VRDLIFKRIADVVGLAVMPIREARAVDKDRQELVATLDCLLDQIDRLRIERMILVERAEILGPNQLDLGLTDGDFESVNLMRAADRKRQTAQQDQMRHGMIPPAHEAAAT